MAVYLEIVDVYAREILDSRGNPTVETEVKVKDGNHIFTGRASVPSGASTGEHEAKELRDTDSRRYHGKGVHQAVVNVNDRIKAVLLGKDATNQVLIDQILNCTDGTDNKCNLGANATLSEVEAINLFAGTDIDIDEKEEVIDMCKAWEEQKNEGRELGREEGRELGREEGRIRQAKVTALKLQKKGHSIEDIAECVDFDEETVKKWLVS